jgi:hypothetical protein
MSQAAIGEPRANIWHGPCQFRVLYRSMRLQPVLPGHFVRYGVRTRSRRALTPVRWGVVCRLNPGVGGTFGLSTCCGFFGEVSERPKEHAWKACNRSNPVRGFESPPLRQFIITSNTASSIENECEGVSLALSLGIEPEAPNDERRCSQFRPGLPALVATSPRSHTYPIQIPAAGPR